MIRDPDLDPDLAALLEGAVELADVLAPVPPAPAVRARLLDSIAAVPTGPGVFERFTTRFAQIFDVTVDRARELFAQACDPASWEPGPGAGTWLIHFQAGPACAGADTGFVKSAPGVRFPWHHHDGEEHNLILAGAALDSHAGRVGPGDEPTMQGGSEHDFTVVGDEYFLYAVRVFGVDFDVPRPDSAGGA